MNDQQLAALRAMGRLRDRVMAPLPHGQTRELVGAMFDRVILEYVAEFGILVVRHV